MNNDKRTTRELAIEYFDDLSHEDRKRLSWKHFNRLDWHHLTDEQIEGIYNWEHPQSEAKKEQPKEGDMYKNMPAWRRENYRTWREWAERCFDAGKKEMEEENKSLREALKRISNMKGHPFPDYELMQKIAKEALNQ